MSDAIRRYERLRGEVETLKAQKQRADGAAEEVAARLAEAGCADERAAEARVKKLEAEADRLESQCSKILDALERELGV